MNNKLKAIDIEKTLFFDCELVRNSKELDVNSKEFALYQKKIRNKETDELPTEQETVEDYRKRAGLKMGYNRIVSIGVGFVKGGEVHIKAIDEGTEEDIIREFCKITQSFDHLCGFNNHSFDTPILVANGMKYFDVTEVLPDKFNTSGKAPWELKNSTDLLTVFKGTHYASNSLDEVCYHFGIPSPKTDLDGSMVSEEFWQRGIKLISEYVKQDVFANINIFRKMRFEPIFESFIDKNNFQPTKLPLLERLYLNEYLSDEIKTELKEKLSKKKMTKKDKENIKTILEAVYISSTHMASDSKEVVERKENEITEFLKTLDGK